MTPFPVKRKDGAQLRSWLDTAGSGITGRIQEGPNAIQRLLSQEIIGHSFMPVLNRLVLLLDQTRSKSRVRMPSSGFSRTYIEATLMYMPSISHPLEPLETIAWETPPTHATPVLQSVRMLKVHTVRDALSSRRYDSSDVLDETASRICADLERLGGRA